MKKEREIEKKKKKTSVKVEERKGNKYTKATNRKWRRGSKIKTEHVPKEWK